ncbi:hypothetical protein [Frankia sp. CcWB3]
MGGPRWAYRDGPAVTDGLTNGDTREQIAAGPGVADPAAADLPAADPYPSRSRGRTNALWTIVDQVVSSGTNAAINFIIARRVDPTEFGAFAIAYTIFAIVVGLSRAAATAPLGISYAAAPAAFRAAARAASGLALVLGAVVGAGLMAVGSVLKGVVGTNLIAMGVVMPALLVQDAWRYTSFAQGRPLRAVVNDLVWAAGMGVGIVLLAIGGPEAAIGGRAAAGGAPVMVLVWGAAAALAAVVGIGQHRVWPAPRRALAWFAGHRETTGFMTAEFVTVQGAQQTSILIIAGIGSPSLVGALRGLQTLLAPTTNLAVALMSLAIPEFARRRGAPARRIIRAAYAVSALVVASSVLWTLIFLILPDDSGAALLGDTWSQTRELLLLAMIAQAGPALSVGPVAVLYAFGRTRLTFWINLFFTPFLLAGPVTGLLLGGAKGVIIGNVIVFWATIPPWIYQLHKQTRAVGRE